MKFFSKLLWMIAVLVKSLYPTNKCYYLVCHLSSAHNQGIGAKSCLYSPDPVPFNSS